MRTSISDIEEYKSICLKSATEDVYFNNFKRNPAYTSIIPGIDNKNFIYYGKKYLEIIDKSNFDFNKLSLIKKNDIVGNDYLEDYGPPFGKISTVTLRYLKVLLEIESIFGKIDGKNIVEIGVGYGGQCLLFMNYFKPKSYTLIDLPEVLQLCKRYLAEYNNINFVPYDQINNEHYDLAISNYAFSECDKNIQLKYIDIFKNSKNGYITYNQISNLFGIDSLSANEFKNIMNCKFMEENPKTDSNIIFYW